MTPQEHGDMRDLVLAGAQRIQPADSHHRLTAVGVAALIVVAIVGGVAAIVNGRGIIDDAPAVAPTHSTPTTLPPTTLPTSPSPTPTMPPEWCEPSQFPRASLSEAHLPAPGERLALEQDPCLTAKSLLGTYTWLEDQGIDADLIQGFQSIAGIEPWTAPLADGTGTCILIRGDDRNSWGTIACDSTGLPATVERTVDGLVLRFVIENGVIAVYATSP
jgi:hypothetical protein